METNLTLDIKDALWSYFNKQGTFICFEVTIGWFGKERVDMLTYDTNKLWRCYEIKSDKKDFNSKSKHTFAGHYNYYVLPTKLYEEVKDNIPYDIGVYLYSDITQLSSLSLVKKAKKRQLLVEESILIDSMIRSLSRDANREYKRNKNQRYPIYPELDEKRFNNRIKRIQENKDGYIKHMNQKETYLKKNGNLDEWLTYEGMIREDISEQVKQLRKTIQEYYLILEEKNSELNKLER